MLKLQLVRRRTDDCQGTVLSYMISVLCHLDKTELPLCLWSYGMHQSRRSDSAIIIFIASINKTVTF